jgi:hypothetical protein
VLHILLQFLFTLAFAPAQDADLVLLKNPMNRLTLPPIVIEKIATGEQVITPGKKFSAPDDWLKHLKVTVRNQSDRMILSVEVSLTFPQYPDGQRRPRQRTLSRGKYYRSSPNPLHGEELNLMPGETIELGISEDQYEDLIQYYGWLPRTALSGIIVAPYIVIFDRDQGWYQDHYVKRDSAEPATWNVEEGKKVY